MPEDQQPRDLPPHQSAVDGPGPIGPLSGRSVPPAAESAPAGSAPGESAPTEPAGEPSSANPEPNQEPDQEPNPAGEPSSANPSANPEPSPAAHAATAPLPQAESEPSPTADAATAPLPRAESEPNPDVLIRQRFARIAGRPEPGPEPHPWNPGRILRRFAGVDEWLMSWVPQERARYTGMGGAVLFTALMAFVSMTVALAIAFDTRSPLIAVVAALWFLLILNLDRWIVSSPLPDKPIQRVPTIALRFGMAFVFGIVIAEPLVLVVFDTAVNQKVQEVRAEELKAYEGKWRACNPDPQLREAAATPLVQPVPETSASAAPSAAPSPGPSAAPSVAPSPSAQAAPVAPAGVDCKDFPGPALNDFNQLVNSRDQKAAQLDGIQAQLAVLVPQHQALVQAAVNDCNGATGHYGFGPVCRQLFATADQFKATHQLDQMNTKAGELRTEIQSLTDQVVAEGSRWRQERDQVIAAKVEEWSQGRGEKAGLLERIEALNLLATKHLALFFGIWAVRLLFILVDTAPALLKFTSGQTTYDRLVAEENKLGELRRRVRRDEESADAQGWGEDHREDLAAGLAQRKAMRANEYGGAPTGRHAVTGAGAGAALLIPPPLPGMPPESPEPEHVLDDLAELSIVTIGGRHAGRTALLTAMYEQLREYDGGSYRLDCPDPAQRAILAEHEHRLGQPGDVWPEPTPSSAVETFDFDCYVRTGDREVLAMRLRFSDFASEALDGARLPREIRDELAGHIGRADAVLIMVSATEIRDAQWDALTATHLTKVLHHCAQWAERATCPVQIVVTKWDQIENTFDTSGQIWSRRRLVQELRRYTPMSHLAGKHQRLAGGSANQRGIRVVPVSVTGSGGAEELPDGRMVKRELGAPVNVDVPLAGVLPDRLHDLLFTGRDYPAFRRRVTSAGQGAREAVSRMLNRRRRHGLDDPKAHWAIAYALDRRLSPQRKEIRDDRALREAARRHHDEGDWQLHAKEVLLGSFTQRLNEFDARFPAPGLTQTLDTDQPG